MNLFCGCRRTLIVNAFSIINFKLPEGETADDAEEGVKLVEGEGSAGEAAPPSVGAKLVCATAPSGPKQG